MRKIFESLDSIIGIMVNRRYEKKKEVKFGA